MFSRLRILLWNGLLFPFILPAIPLEASGPATNDQSAFEHAFINADSAYEVGNYVDAILYYREARASLEDADEYEALIRTYLRAGSAFTMSDEPDSALAELNEGLAIAYSHLDDNHIYLAKFYRLIGTVHYHTGEHQTARENYDRALDIHRLNYYTHTDELAGLYNNLGSLENFPDDAIGWYKLAVQMYTQNTENQSWHLGRTFRNIGINYYRLGLLDSATVYIEKTIDIYQRHFGENHPRVAEVYAILGSYKSFKGDHQTGLEYQYRALTIYEGTIDKNDERLASIHNNLGNIHDDLGNYRKAIDHFTIAIAVTKNLEGDRRRSLGFFHANAALTYRKMERYDDAISFHYKGLDYLLQVFGDNHPMIASVYNQIGITYANKGDFDKAADYYNRGVEIVIDTQQPRLSMLYNNLGDLYERRSDLAAALTYYQKAIISVLPAFTDTSIYSNPVEIHTNSPHLLMVYLKNKARTFRELYDAESNDIADLQAALNTYAAAVRLIQTVQTGIRSEESSLWLADESHPVFEESIVTALELYNATEETAYLHDAFTFSEMNKTSVLWQSLAEVGARTLAGIPDSVLAIESDIRSEIAQYEIEMLSHEPGSEAYKRSADEYYAKKTGYDRFLSALERSYPDFYELKYRLEIPSIELIQETLDDQSALVQYFLGGEDLVIFAVTHNRFFVHRQTDIAGLSADIDAMLRSVRRVDAGAFFDLSNGLYHRLIAPIRPQLEGIDRLIIVPDGIVSYLPFEVLSSDTAGEQQMHTTYDSANYLIKDFEITYQYSARLYLHSRNNYKPPASPSFAGFAPVFHSEPEAQIALASGVAEHSRSIPHDEAYRSIVLDAGLLMPLPHSREEIVRTTALFKQRGYRAAAFLFDEASEDNFKKNAKQYSIIHIASHGIIHDHQPKLSGIVFAQPTIGEYNEDGILFSNETYNLELNADLVVLSSCDSGIGEYARGEGLIALTRGFLYSGTSNIIVSLWKISDRHTSDLMIEFYGNVLDGKPYGQALREAKLAMLQNEATAIPRLWSGFVLVGH